MCFRGILEKDSVSSLPIRDAIIAYPSTLVRAAVAFMKDKSLGCVVMVDYQRRPTGIFTEKSILKLLIENAPLDERPVYNFADPCFFAVKSSDPIMRVWEAIQSKGARYVCVTDSDGKIMGVTGQRGIAEYVADCFARQTTVQRLGSTPWMQQREGA